jgi:hypothetical protein
LRRIERAREDRVMESGRFDNLTRVLRRLDNRRGLLAAALAGAVGLLGLEAPETSGRNAAKACQGKRGDKKKKCLKKAKARDRECRNDGDCADRSTLCQGGKCRVACPEGACAGCTGCVTKLISEDERARVCANQLTQVAPDTCATDADCTGNASDVCLRIGTSPCTQPPCGLCFAAVNVCVP